MDCCTLYSYPHYYIVLEESRPCFWHLFFVFSVTVGFFFSVVSFWGEFGIGVDVWFEKWFEIWIEFDPMLDSKFLRSKEKEKEKEKKRKRKKKKRKEKKRKRKRKKKKRKEKKRKEKKRKEKKRKEKKKRSTPLVICHPFKLQ